MVPLWLKVTGHVNQPTLYEELSSYRLAHLTFERQLPIYQACRHESCDDSRRVVIKCITRWLHQSHVSHGGLGHIYILIDESEEARSSTPSLQCKLKGISWPEAVRYIRKTNTCTGERRRKRCRRRRRRVERIQMTEDRVKGQG